MLAMMDDRENQNPNQLKKSQSVQAEELKKLNLSKTASESCGKNDSAASNEDSKSKAIKHSSNQDTKKIMASASNNLKCNNIHKHL